mmetsp:Transcript_59778/g.175374  ORF Transcript_59778/g.175374 Transcript_59778/m.175374 type:complete len:346 (-) Transcript_59778:63-1100(-)
MCPAVVWGLHVLRGDALDPEAQCLDVDSLSKVALHVEGGACRGRRDGVREHPSVGLDVAPLSAVEVEILEQDGDLVLRGVPGVGAREAFRAAAHQGLDLSQPHGNRDAHGRQNLRKVLLAAPEEPLVRAQALRGGVIQTLQHGHELAVGGRADDLPPMAVPDEAGEAAVGADVLRPGMDPTTPQGVQAAQLGVHVLQAPAVGAAHPVSLRTLVRAAGCAVAHTPVVRAEGRAAAHGPLVGAVDLLLVVVPGRQQAAALGPTRLQRLLRRTGGRSGRQERERLAAAETVAHGCSPWCGPRGAGPRETRDRRRPVPPPGPGAPRAPREPCRPPWGESRPPRLRLSAP